MTEKLYLEDPYLRTCEAEVLAVADGQAALSRTIFHGGGGGQPPDRGTVQGAALLGVREADGQVWHQTEGALTPGESVKLELDWPFRHALMRAHALMHVVNTVARDRFSGAITGVQLGPDQSRVDFRLTFTREQLPEFEALVNEVIARDCAVTSSSITEEEFRQRPELIRTLNVLPPVIDGRVRIVTIEGFDVQACGGTHVHSTREIGPATIEKFDNKGKENKRFYWRLTPPVA